MASPLLWQDGDLEPRLMSSLKWLAWALGQFSLHISQPSSGERGCWLPMGCGDIQVSQLTDGEKRCTQPHGDGNSEKHSAFYHKLKHTMKKIWYRVVRACLLPEFWFWCVSSTSRGGVLERTSSMSGILSNLNLESGNQGRVNPMSKNEGQTQYYKCTGHWSPLLESLQPLSSDCSFILLKCSFRQFPSPFPALPPCY